MYNYSKSTTTTYGTSHVTTWEASRTTTTSYTTFWSTTKTTSYFVNTTKLTTWSYSTYYEGSRSTDDGINDCIVGGTLVHVNATETKRVEDLILNEPILTMDGPHNIEIEQGLPENWKNI